MGKCIKGKKIPEQTVEACGFFRKKRVTLDAGQVHKGMERENRRLRLGVVF